MNRSDFCKTKECHLKCNSYWWECCGLELFWSFRIQIAGSHWGKNEFWSYKAQMFQKQFHYSPLINVINITQCLKVVVFLLKSLKSLNSAALLKHFCFFENPSSHICNFEMQPVRFSENVIKDVFLCLVSLANAWAMDSPFSEVLWFVLQHTNSTLVLMSLCHALTSKGCLVLLLHDLCCGVCGIFGNSYTKCEVDFLKMTEKTVNLQENVILQ